MEEELLKRITITSDICHGKPCIRGMRMMVSSILELLAGGMTPEEILGDYSFLEKEDIQACLMYAALMANHQRYQIPEESVV